ncbi:MAG TPA: OmpA family protein [Candidatus Kapabacteria bacterium]|nr:OmpA family protein [Candidatus Kapabacteria bacterium]
MKRYYTAFASIIILVLACSTLQAQDVQWASEVISFSSQFGTKEYSANQVLGKPNKCPASGDSPCAWVAKNDAAFGGGEAHIKVGYNNPMKIQQVAIAENFNPGAVQQVILYDAADKPHRVYFGDPAPAGVPSRVMNVFFKKTDYKVVAVELVLQCGLVRGYNEIDAIGISDSKIPVKAEINIAPGSKIFGVKENLGPNVNSPYDEVFPVISPDGKTLYFDSKDNPANYGYMPGKACDNIWYSEVLPNGSWGPAHNIGPLLNNGNGTFLASITPDGNMALIGGIYNEKPDAGPSFGIWTTKRTTNGWSKPDRLKMDTHTTHHFMEFCLANDGKKIIMSLQREEGNGGRDLYVYFLQDDGSWQGPKNLGTTVNSAADEGMPFLASDGKTLYFSSDGHPGYGSVDMFMTKRLDDTWENWSEPQNLGPDFNTPEWDAYYTVPASGEYAYFVSNKDAYGNSLDIFRAKLPPALKPEPVVLVSGKVFDGKTGKPLAADIHYEILPGAKDAGIAHSNPKDGSYKIVLPAGQMYGFRAEVKGYIPVDENLDVKKVTEYKEINRDLKLVPFEAGETVRLNNIFFDFNKSVLHEESNAVLDRLVVMLKQQPAITLEISGHTDNKGSESLNQKLSQARAISVRNYLIAKGIAKSRITAKGFGASKPIATNDTEDGRQQNRRVEFTIGK